MSGGLRSPRYHARIRDMGRDAGRVTVRRVHGGGSPKREAASASTRVSVASTRVEALRELIDTRLLLTLPALMSSSLACALHPPPAADCQGSDPEGRALPPVGCARGGAGWGWMGAMHIGPATRRGRNHPSISSAATSRDANATSPAHALAQRVHRRVRRMPHMPCT